MLKKFISIYCIILIVALNLSACTNAMAQDEIHLDEVDCKNTLTLDEKIGQMLCLDFRFWNKNSLQGKEKLGIVDDNQETSQKPVIEINDEIRQIIAKYHIGSIILFSQNFVNKDQAKKLIDDLQKAAKDVGNPPLIIAVDQEGGRVERFSFGRGRLKNNAEIKTSEEAFEKGSFIGKELKDIGINCNFAPVVDVNSNPNNPVINVRSFGDNLEIVSEFGKNFMKGLHSQNIIATAKHFPGHGDTSVDSHFGLPRVDKTLEHLKDVELRPFKALIDENVDMIMTAHIEFPQIETKTVISKKDGKEIFLPATLSRTILTELLRKQMGFDGVIVTDSMIMKAISENFGEEESIKRAISAGADMICIPTVLRSKDDIAKLEGLINYLKEAVECGEISKAQINTSVERILKLKEKYCD